MIEIVAFDADDTLWHNEEIFIHTQHQLIQIVSQYCDPQLIHDKMVATERANIHLFGYGIKGFTLSMIETAITLSEGKISADDIRKIIQLGKAMLDSPLQVIDHVEDVLKSLKKHYKLAMITKGDLLDQTNKIKESGLGDYFDYLHVVSEKDTQTYTDLFKSWNMTSEKVMMVGNSILSDVLPVLEIGGHGVHIPYETTAPIEQTDKKPSGPKFKHIKRIDDLPHYLDQLQLHTLI